MNMGRHLRRYLNYDTLRAMPGEMYEGRIAAVTEQHLRNRYTTHRQLEPVIAFDDGYLLVPNLTQRVALCEAFGTPETENWIGEQLTVFLLRTERLNKRTGQLVPSVEKRVRLTRPDDVRERQFMQAEEKHLSESLSES